MGVEINTILIFGSLILLLVMGVPLAFCLTSIGLIFNIISMGFNSTVLLTYNTFGSSWNEVFIAVPMFVLMGGLLEKSGLADELFEAMHQWFGSVKGGLAIGTVVICAIFAAMTGVTGAATVTMGMIAVPAMLKRGYNKNLALGSVAAAGTLGILIPPSVSMVLIGAIAQISIGKLFMGGIFSGLLITLLFVVYIALRARLQPGWSSESTLNYSFKDKLKSLKAIIVPGCIILSVTGTIIFGLATPTESSAVGAAFTLLLVLVQKRINIKTLKLCTYQSFQITGMVMWIVFGAVCFSNMFLGIGGLQLIQSHVVGSVQPWVVISIALLIIFFLGLFLDPTGIIFIVVPIIFPILKGMNIDLVWFGVIMVMALQIGYITPPFGFNLFYLKATVPSEISLGDIYNSVWPFVGLLLLGIIICMIFPEIITWLPARLIK